MFSDCGGFLHAHGIDVDPDTLSSMVEAAVRQLPRVLYTEPRHDLTPAEVDALERGGLDLEPADLGRDDPLARTAAAYAALLETSMTTAEAAGLLGVNESRVRQRLLARPQKLYGLRIQGAWRIPRFQFSDGRLLPGWPEVLARLDPDLHPVSLLSWLTSQHADLETDEQTLLSPRDWLRAGYSPEVIAELAGCL